MSATESRPDPARFGPQLEQLGARLREEIRATLLRLDAERYATLAGQVHDTKDQSLVRLLEETRHADIRRDAQELADVENALARLKAGRYGLCTDCGTTVPEARLAAWPTAKRCRPCQEKHEQQRR